MIIIKRVLLILTVLIVGQACDAFFPINYFRPYNINLMPEHSPNKCFQITGVYEGGFNFHGFAADDEEESVSFTRKVNILQVYQDTQDALAAFKGFAPSSPLALFGQQFNRDDDDGIRGHLVPTADLELKANLIFSARYYFPQDIILAVHVPFLVMELHNVQWRDLTGTVRAEDRRVRELLTDQFVSTIRRLANLDLTGWQRSGFGDVVVMGQWLRDFPQPKPLLKNVRLNGRLGLTLPTGVKRDEDRLFAIPFGNDGSVGIVFGAGIDLRFGSMLKAGGDIELLHLFGSTRDRRIKIDPGQTDLLFLAKDRVFKEFGWTQQFNLYVQAWRFYRGFSFKVDYEYTKHFEDKVWLSNAAFDPIIANSAQSLQESTMHGVILNLAYDFSQDLCDPVVGPYISFFGKVGFNGKRAIIGNTFGVALSLSF